MTESEWFACTDPKPMLEFLQHKVSERKMRLFAVASCRRIWAHLTEEGSRHAVEVAERFADGLATTRQLALARAISQETRDPVSSYGGDLASASYVASKSVWVAAEGVARCTQVVFSNEWDITARRISRAQRQKRQEALAAIAERDRIATQRALVAFLHDIFRPFSLVSIDPSWQTSTVLTLAAQMYETRDFTAIPILADALADAGCPEESPLLSHCRGPGPHVRGCWVVDAVLGRS